MMTREQGLPDLIRKWSALEGVAMGDGRCAPELLGQSNDAAHLALEVRFPDAAPFFLDFFVKQISGAASPFVLLNTRVADPDSRAKPYYSDILQLLRTCVPPQTLLVTYVRQFDSLQMLETARLGQRTIEPSVLPLVQMFERAGWKFLKLTPFLQTPHPHRRYLIRFETLP